MRIKKPKKLNRDAIGKQLSGLRMVHYSDEPDADGNPTIHATYRHGPIPVGMLELTKIVPLLWKITVFAVYASGTQSTEFTLKNPAILKDLENIVDTAKSEILVNNDTFPTSVGWSATVLG